jgi:hypothetical protein
MTLYQYIDAIYRRIMSGTASPPLSVPDFPPQVVEDISGHFELIFVVENASEGNVCLANAEEVRPEYRTAFSSIDLLNYYYAVLHLPEYRRRYTEFSKTESPWMPCSKDAVSFWRLAELGGQLRQLHLLESPRLEHHLHPFPIEGSNIVWEPRFVVEGKVGDLEANSFPSAIGRIYINDSQYFGEVPVSVWNYDLGTYQPAQKWLKDGEGRKLELEDILHYQKIIGALSETERLIKEIQELRINVV